MSRENANRERENDTFTVRVGTMNVILKNPEKMTREELISEVKLWRSMVIAADEQTRYLLSLCGREVIVVFRNYQSVRGILYGVTFKPEILTIGGPIQYFDPMSQRMKVAIALQSWPWANIITVAEPQQFVELAPEAEPQTEVVPESEAEVES